MAHKPVLYIVIPCYNEESVLPITSGMFRDKVRQLADAGKSKRREAAFCSSTTAARTRRGRLSRRCPRKTRASKVLRRAATEGTKGRSGQG